MKRRNVCLLSMLCLLLFFSSPLTYFQVLHGHDSMLKTFFWLLFNDKVKLHLLPLFSFLRATFNASSHELTFEGAVREKLMVSKTDVHVLSPFMLVKAHNKQRKFPISYVNCMRSSSLFLKDAQRKF